eukprot:11067406-Alexandrium_andersonii.AAC.1
MGRLQVSPEALLLSPDALYRAPRKQRGGTYRVCCPGRAQLRAGRLRPYRAGCWARARPELTGLSPQGAASRGCWESCLLYTSDAADDM